MGIPAFASTDIEHGVTVVFNDVAAVVKMESKGVASVRSVWQEDTKSVVTAGTQLLPREAFILEEEEIFTGGEREGVRFERAGKLNE